MAFSTGGADGDHTRSLSLYITTCSSGICVCVMMIIYWEELWPPYSLVPSALTPPPLYICRRSDLSFRPRSFPFRFPFNSWIRVLSRNTWRGRVSMKRWKNLEEGESVCRRRGKKKRFESVASMLLLFYFFFKKGRKKFKKNKRSNTFGLGHSLTL